MTVHTASRVADPTVARLIVGIDGTSASWEALAWAAEDMASHTLADGPRRMLLCRVYPPGTVGARLPDPPDMAWLGYADPGLARALRQVRQRYVNDDIGVRVRDGDLADQLVASSAGDTLTVLPAPLSDVAAATRVAALAAGVVVAVRPTTPAVDVTAGPFAGHVVVGVDGGASSRSAVQFAFDYADRHHKPVAAVHAAADEPTGTWVDGDLPEIHLVTHAFEMDLLEAAIADAHRHHPDVHVRRFVLRDCADRALVSASKGAVLLVVGDRGRGPVARRILGSVSCHVVRTAHCAVAVVHESGESS